MAIYYFDSSALVKYYVTELGSAWVHQLIDAHNTKESQYEHIILVAEITRVETAAGLAIIERVGRIRRKVREQEYLRVIHQFANRYMLLSVTKVDYERASDLTQRHPLKAYDAVQVAVALRYQQELSLLNQTLVFISGDKKVNAAAQAEGLIVDDPFNHVVTSDKS